MNLWQINRQGCSSLCVAQWTFCVSGSRGRCTCERACVHVCFREITEPHRQTYTDTLENYHVFIFVNLWLAGRECFPLLSPSLSLILHGREAAAAARKSSGKPLMDNYATTPRPQHLAPLSFLLHKNNNKQVADPAVRFCHSFPTVGAADAEKFPFFRMHI